MKPQNQILLFISIIMLVLFFSFSFAKAIPDCQPGEWGIQCQDYPQYLDGYYPLGSVVYFCYPGFADNQPAHTDIGIVDSYWFDVNEQRYYYKILSHPSDPLSANPLTTYDIVAHQNVYHVIN